MTLSGLSCVSLSPLPFFLSQTPLWNCPPYVHLMLGLLDCLLVCTVLFVLCPSLESTLTFVNGSVQRVLETRIVFSTLNGEFKCYSSKLSTDVLPTKRCSNIAEARYSPQPNSDGFWDGSMCEWWMFYLLPRGGAGCSPHQEALLTNTIFRSYFSSGPRRALLFWQEGV